VAPGLNLGFPKSSRLLKRQEFRKTLDDGERVACPQMVVGGIPRGEAITGARLGLVVSKKVGNSVVRNRVKRRLRESFRLIRSQLPDVDLVVIAREAASQCSSAELREAFQNCLRRLLRRLRLADKNVSG
jgi:ribonuclease P protein component